MKRTSTTARGLLALDAESRHRFEAFAREMEPGLLSAALMLCGNRPDAEDLVQETLECALESFSRLRLGAEGRAWLGTVLRHRFIDHCRRPKGRPLDEQVLAREEILAAPEPDEEPVWAKVTPEAYHRAVEQLPEELRDVYLPKAMEGRTYQEIARRLGIPPATVGTRLLRARRVLKALLSGDERREAP